METCARVSASGSPGRREQRASLAKALRRTQVARFDATEVDHQLLEHDAGVHHPEFQCVNSGSAQCVLRAHLANAVFDGCLPVAWRIVRDGVDEQWRLAVERDGIAESAPWLEVKRGL